MSKIFQSFIRFTLSCVFLASCQSSTEQKATKIAIVVPIHHQALEDMQQGFVEELQKKLDTSLYSITTVNSMGNHALLQTQLRQLKGYDIIVPIGTSTTQMAQAINKEQTIVFLAANTEQITQTDALFGVEDEIPGKDHLAFIERVVPGVDNITLVYSASDKIFPEVEALKTLTKEKGITLNCLMVQNGIELFRLSKSIPSDTQAIFILKDHIVVSGVEVLAKTAEEKQIPLIASDEGSVKKGASFALGVQERAIGIKGAELVAAYIQNGIIAQPNIVRLEKGIVFFNEEAAIRQGLSVEKTLASVKVAGTAVQEVGHGQ